LRMRFALPAFAIVALIAAGAAYESRTPSRTPVPAIDLRPEPRRAVTARKRERKPLKKQHMRKRSSARARFSSGRGGAGAAPAPPSPALPAGEDNSDRDDDDDGDD
jgi:hypothetical protein